MREKRRADPAGAKETEQSYRARNLERVRAIRRKGLAKFYSNPANREKRAAYGRQWYQSNKDKRKAQLKQYAQSNPEVINAASRRWHHANPEKVKILSHRYRERVRAAEGDFSEDQWFSLCAKYDHRCLRCSDRNPLTVDHVIPLSKGGTGYIDNIQPLCQPCNSSKGTRSTDYR